MSISFWKSFWQGKFSQGFEFKEQPKKNQKKIQLKDKKKFKSFDIQAGLLGLQYVYSWMLWQETGEFQEYV